MTNGTPRGKIPDWFEIQDYSAAASFKPADWHLQLNVRHFLFRFIHPDGPRWRHRFRSAANDIFDAIQNFPILTIDDLSDVTSKSHLFGIGKYAPVSQITLRKTMQVLSSLRYWETLAEIMDEAGFDMEYVEEIPLEDLVDLIELRFLQQLKHPDDSILTLDDTSMDYGNPPGVLAVEININYSDEEILSATKSWLKRMRSKYPSHTQKTRNFTQNEFKRWANHGILPYLDLVIWSIQRGVTLRQHEIGNAIFPDETATEVDVTEKVRKTTKPLAEQLMSGDAINILEGMIN